MGATGIIIGRFQNVQIPAELQGVIAEIGKQHELLAIIIGAHKTGATQQNPLDAEIRKAMINADFPGIDLYTLDDNPSDSEWSASLDKLIEAKFIGHEVVLYGSEDGFIERYKGKFKAVAKGKSYSPPKVESVPHSSEFRRGIVFGLQNTFPKVYPTVDVAVFRNQRSEVLLGMKSAGRKWRFPGGFTDPADEKYEDAARRELKEECGLADISALTYEASFKVDDWRYRLEEDKIITILFSADLVSGEATAGDDLEVVEWISLSRIRELLVKGEIAPEHLPLFKHLLQKYHR